MEEVDLSGNYLDDNTAKIVSTCMHNIEKVAGKRSHKVESIFHAIKHVPAPVNTCAAIVFRHRYQG